VAALAIVLPLLAVSLGVGSASVAAIDVRGVYVFDVCPGQASGTCSSTAITQTSTIATEDLTTGAVTGTGSDSRHAWTLAGTVTGSTLELTANYTDVSAQTTLTATVTPDGATITGTYATTGVANGHGVMTGTRTSAPPGGPTAPTGSGGPAGGFVLCVPSDCSGISLGFPKQLSAGSPITLTVACGDEEAEASRVALPRARTAEQSICRQKAILQHLMTTVNLNHHVHEESATYSRRDERLIRQALTELSTTDANATVRNAAAALAKDPTLTPDAQTTSEAQTLIQALSLAAQTGEGDPGLTVVDESLSSSFTEPGAAASSSRVARSAATPSPSATATLAALIARRPSEADNRAFAQTTALATASQPSSARGAARVTLTLATLLALHRSPRGSHSHTPVLISSTGSRPVRPGRTTIVIHPTGEGGRVLREL
jgi:hypothetical protein